MTGAYIIAIKNCSPYQITRPCSIFIGEENQLLYIDKRIGVHIHKPPVHMPIFAATITTTTTTTTTAARIRIALYNLEENFTRWLPNCLTSTYFQSM